MPDPRFAKELDPSFAVFIGRAAVAWSAVEFTINQAIWAVADVSPAVGACLTSQIFTFEGRAKALLSLMKLRRFPKPMIDAVNKFAESARGAQDIRNRIVHDPWMWNAVGTVGRMEITARRKLSFSLIPIDLETLKKDYEKLEAFAKRSVAIKGEIYDALESLPEIPRKELHPIDDHRPVPRNRAKPT